MKTKKKKSKVASNRLEKSYKKYFAPIRILNPADESMSLEQPSHLKNVESFTTYGILEEPLLCCGIK